MANSLIFDDRGDGERVSHVVVMGIGEPFDNYDNVLRFLRTINNDNGLAIGARHITVSTSGLAPKIKEFANVGVQVHHHHGHQSTFVPT